MRSDSELARRDQLAAILSAHSAIGSEDFQFVRDPARHFVPSRRFLRRAVRWCFRGRLRIQEG